MHESQKSKKEICLSLKRLNYPIDFSFSISALQSQFVAIDHILKTILLMPDSKLLFLFKFSCYKIIQYSINRFKISKYFHSLVLLNQMFKIKDTFIVN